MALKKIFVNRFVHTDKRTNTNNFSKKLTGQPIVLLYQFSFTAVAAIEYSFTDLVIFRGFSEVPCTRSSS